MSTNHAREAAERLLVKLDSQLEYEDSVTLVANVIDAARAEAWQPIETAPKGQWARLVTDPDYIKPPQILLAFEDGSQSVAYWDWYYAEGGNGFIPGELPWVEPVSGRLVSIEIGKPTHWMPLPEGPQSKGETP